MPLPYLIYVRTCPVCGDGLCRVRVCPNDQHLVGSVLCDECESIWTDPSMNERVYWRSESIEPSCPDCGQSLWSEQCHWADVQEICLLGWYDQVRIART